MDTKPIKQFGSDILCYRIRTARQKKRMQYEDFDKQLLALSKEENILYKNKYTPEWEPLTPPIQRGWKRYFVLRVDVARSKQAQFFEDILKKINTHDWSYRKDFKVKKRKFGRKIYVVKAQQLLKPGEWHFNRLGLNEAERQFFHPEYVYEQARGKFVKHYVFNEPWRFVLRVRPDMINRKKKIDSVTEARLDEIRNYIQRNDLRKRLQKIFDGNYKRKVWNQTEKEREKYVFKSKSLCQILNAQNGDSF